MKVINIAIILGENTSLSSALSIYDIFDFINNISSIYHLKIDFLSTDKYRIQHNNHIIINTINLKKQKNNYQFIILPSLKKVKSSIPKDDEIITWLRYMYHKGENIICSSCASSYFLAYAGLLSNKNATTHWKLEEDFQKKFPEVNLQIHKLIVDENNIITSGGGYSYIDMTFYIINKFISHNLAYHIAKQLVVDMGRISQAYFKTLPIQIKNHNVEIEKLLDWTEKQEYQILTVKKMADFLSMSPKTLIRKFNHSTGLIPLEYIHNLKVEKAKVLLVDGTLTFTKITEILGYSNPSSFRKLFKKLTKLSPQQYRNKFINISK